MVIVNWFDLGKRAQQRGGRQFHKFVKLKVQSGSTQGAKVRMLSTKARKRLSYLISNDLRLQAKYGGHFLFSDEKYGRGLSNLVT